MSARTEWRNRDEGKKKANNSNEILLWAKKQDRHEHLILGTKTSQFISHKTKISYDDDDSKIDTPKSKAGIHDYRRKHSWSFWPTLLSQREGNPFCSTVEATGIDHPLFPLWISAHFKIPFINLDWPLLLDVFHSFQRTTSRAWLLLFRYVGFLASLWLYWPV